MTDDLYRPEPVSYTHLDVYKRQTEHIAVIASSFSKFSDPARTAAIMPSSSEAVGTHGTTAALALLNDAVKKGGVMACNQVGGLSGAFIPVSEDEGMIAAAVSYTHLKKS